MDKNPHVKIHKVLGNHENVIKFRHAMDKLQHDFKDNFQWSPEAIRLGNGLFIHGDMPMHSKKREQIDDTRDKYRMRVAHDEHKWSKVWTALEKPGYKAVKISGRRGPKRAPGYIDDHLEAWPATGKMNYMENGQTKILLPDIVAEIGHVFSGHTHIKYDHRDRDGTVRGEGYKGRLYHNSGAVVEVTSHKAEDLGILEAELHADGLLHHIQPVSLDKDKHMVAVCGRG